MDEDGNKAEDVDEDMDEDEDEDGSEDGNVDKDGNKTEDMEEDVDVDEGEDGNEGEAGDEDNRQIEMKGKTKMTNQGNKCVEIQLRDGTLSMFIGKVVSVDDNRITLCEASWIASTGRRHLFFAGTPDEDTEIEPYPDETNISLPLEDSVITDWPHPLPREAR